MQRVIDVVSTNIERYADRASARLLSADIPMYERFTHETLRPLLVPGFVAIAEDLANGTTAATPAFFRKVSVLRASQGTDVADLIHGVETGYDAISDHIDEVFAGDFEALAFWERRRREISSATLIALNYAYFTRREEIIAEQNAEIRRLAAPILPVARGVLVLPLVGSLDASRASQIIEALLSHVSQARAEVAIIDVTGVAEVDSGVARVIGQMAESVRLLGAQVILVGVSPAIARTIVRMGLSLGHITTLANLESGVLHALRLQNKAIAHVAQAR